MKNSFYVEESYRWHSDVMDITSRIVHDTDEARLSNIAEHFEVDLSEIRDFIKTKLQRNHKPITNADRIRAMSDEEMAQIFWETAACELCKLRKRHCSDNFKGTWLDWLKQEAEEGEI